MIILIKDDKVAENSSYVAWNNLFELESSWGSKVTATSIIIKSGVLETNLISIDVWLVRVRGVHNQVPEKSGIYFNDPCFDPVYPGTQINRIGTPVTRFY